MIQDLNSIKGLEQGRATFAYKCAKEGSKLQNRSEYRAYVKKIPMLIKTNGLGATYAFIMSKSNDKEDKSGYAYRIIYNQTVEWLRKENKGLIDLRNEKVDLVEAIIALDSSSYRALTVEILALFGWLRRFAEGLICEDQIKE